MFKLGPKGMIRITFYAAYFGTIPPRILYDHEQYE